MYIGDIVQVYAGPSELIGLTGTITAYVGSYLPEGDLYTVDFSPNQLEKVNVYGSNLIVTSAPSAEAITAIESAQALKDAQVAAVEAAQAAAAAGDLLAAQAALDQALAISQAPAVATAISTARTAAALGNLPALQEATSQAVSIAKATTSGSAIGSSAILALLALLLFWKRGGKK